MQPLIRLLDSTNPLPRQELCEFSQRLPPRGVHVHVFLVVNVLLVEVVDVNQFRAVRRVQLLEEVALELSAEVVRVLFKVGRYGEHFAGVGFRGDMAFHSVLISVLLLADLTLPS